MGIRAHARLTPAMSSRKLLVKAFIEQFYAEHGMGPSLAEIAAGTGAGHEFDLSRARRAIRALAREGLIDHLPGVPRGVRPIGVVEQALELLRARGWVINDEDQAVATIGQDVLDFTPEAGLIVTKTTLPRPLPTRQKMPPVVRNRGGRANGEKGQRRKGEEPQS